MRLVLAVVALVGCTKANFVPCADNAACDYLTGGECRANPATGTMWCAEPDTTCPSGLRWDDLAVGDDVGGTCVPGGPACTPKLAWQSERDGNQEIYVGNPDGTEQMNLTRDPEGEGSPQWSPAGDRIAYQRTGPASTAELWIINADGTGARGLSSGYIDSGPRWSPDGTRLAFTRKRPNISGFDIWIVNTTAGPATKISLDASASDVAATWSPDGSSLAFISSGAGGSDIYTMNADGTNRIKRSNDGMVQGHSGYGFPRFSPDGETLLYVSTSTGDAEVWSVPAGGGNATNLSQSPSTEDDGDEGEPQWSPDGSTIYFARLITTPTFDISLYKMNTNGTAQTPLGLLVYTAAASALDTAFELSPSGDEIAWMSYRDGNAEIYVSSLATPSPTRITNDPADDYSPEWRPCP